MAAIFVGSSQSVLPGPLGLRSVWGDVFQEATHMAEYAILAALSCRGVRNTLGRRTNQPHPVAAQGVHQPKWEVPLLVLVIAVAYAILDEWHQSFVPGRCCSFLDIVLDGAGAAIAITALRNKKWGTRNEK
jgi:hypothetical protein